MFRRHSLRCHVGRPPSCGRGITAGRIGCLGADGRAWPQGSGGKGRCRDGLAEPRAAARRGVGVWDGACTVMMIDAFRIDRRANGAVLRTWT